MEKKKQFVFGVAVSDYNFTGRKEEAKRLLTDFRNGINVILMSPRRMGKTSLVKYVSRQVNDESIIIVYLDIFGCKSEYEFYNKLTESVLRQTASKKELWLEEAKNFILRLTPTLSVSLDPASDYSVSLGITPKTHTPEEVLSLAEIIAKKKGKRIVVCIDEFQQIGEMKDSAQVQARLRSVWQHQQNVSYCLFGSKHHLMGSIFLNRSMPFYQFGDLITLKEIATTDWIEYIISHFADGKRTINEKLATEICSLVGNYSAYVQQLSWLVFTKANEGEIITSEYVQQAFEELLNINEILFIQLVEPLSQYQLNFLRALAAGITNSFTIEAVRKQYNLGSYSNITRIQSALLERDLITKQMDEYSFTDPVFAKWVARKFL